LSDCAWTVSGAAERLFAACRARQQVLLLTGLTLVAAVLRLYGITDKSVWNDEAYVITLAQRSVPDILRGLIELDPHPPLYYLFMHLWLRLGTDPLTARLPSALISTACVPLLYALGMRLVGRQIALAAATLLTVSAFHIAWAQEARMYALLGLLCLLSTYFLVRGLQGGGWIWWVLHALISAATLYTQFAAVFYLSAQAAGVLFLLLRDRTLRSSTAPWLLSQIAAAWLFVPWLPAFIVQNRLHGGILYDHTTFAGVEWLFRELTHGSVPYWKLPFGVGMEVGLREGVLLGALVVTGIGMAAFRGTPGGILLPWLFLGTIGFFAVVGFWGAIIIPKAILPASFAYYLLICAGFAAWRRPGVMVAGVVLLVLLNLVGVARYHVVSAAAGGGFREDWGQIVGRLKSDFRPDDVLLVDSSAGLISLDYHLGQQRLAIEPHGVPFEPWAVSPPRLTDEDFRRVDELLRGRSEVWVVWYRNNLPDSEGQLLPYVASRYWLRDTLTVSRVRLYRFEAQP